MTLSPSNSLPRGTVGTPYYQTITALPLNSGSSPTVSYSLAFSSLGLNISASGNQLTISGTPTADGTVTFTVTAADSDGSTQPQDYSLTINSPTTLTPGNATVTFNTAGLSVPITATITTPSTVVLSGTVTFMVLNATGSVVGNVQASVVNGQAQATLNLPSLPAGNYTITESYHDRYGSFSDSSGTGHLIIKQPPLPGGGSGGTGSGSGGSVTLNVPPLLAFFDSLLGGVETVNANGTETITDFLFGFPLLVATFDHSGNLESVELFGFDVTLLFE